MSTYEDALAVTKFTFDPTDPGFLEYAEHQAVLYKAGVPGSRRYQFVMDHGATKEEFLRDEYFQRSARRKEPPHERYTYSPEQMEAHWEILRAAKGSLQLCWEEYQRCWEEYYRSCWKDYQTEMENQIYE